MDLHWIYEGLAIRLIWWLLALVGGIIVAYLKAKGKPWATPALYGLGGFALIVFLGVASERLLTQPQERITAENIEGHVKAWFDNFHFAVRSEPNEQAYFRRVATLPNGNKVIATRLKDLARYLTLQTILTPGKEEQALWDKLSPPRFGQVVLQMTIEAARSKTIFTSRTRPFVMVLEKRIPITNDLTEAVLIQHIDELDCTVVLLQNIVVNMFKEYGLTK